MFHRSLAGLCRSELPLPHALASLQDDLTSGKLRHECADMAAEIESGVPFEDAYARRSERFPPTYRALVEAGLASGDLPGVLDEIARDAGLRSRVRDQLRRRLELPLIAAVVVFVIGALLTLTIAPVVPTSPPLINGRVEHIAAPPTGLFVVTSVGLLALFALVLGGVTLLRKPLDPGSGPRGWRYRLPLFGRLHGHAAKAGFATTLALLLRRELPLPRALALCAASSDGSEIQAQVNRMAAAAEDGASLAESIRAGDLIPPSLLWFVESAGSPAASARALDDIAAIYRQRLQRATDRATTFALPAVELIIGLVVLTFAMAYVLPAYDLFGLFRL
ncbi:MAG: type II secretion system F family protein [bacterium]|nr:type II secretion system F family protein [bacterium]